MQLNGFHHLTAVTAHAPRNHGFYTGTLGMRLVKKSVNQDDVSSYHLFYADGKGSPGTDVTFFDWPAAPERRGTRSVVRTGLRVASEASLYWWSNRFRELGVKQGEIATRDGRPTLDFEDFEGQRLSLICDPENPAGEPWDRSPVPAEHQIRGLGSIAISVPVLAPTDQVLTGLMGMTRTRSYAAGPGSALTVQVYAMAQGGPARELHVLAEPEAAVARLGAGGVHHVAFRTTAADYEAWADRLAQGGTGSSGPVDRYYFRSLYFREPGGILFEIATDEPGFAADEPLATLGQKLALPPFLEGRRAQIEAGLKPLAT
jgi:glyoxalase family protein